MVDLDSKANKEPSIDKYYNMEDSLEERVSQFFERVSRGKKQNHYFYMRKLESSSGARVTVDGREMLMLASNNYLGMTTHPKVKEAAKKALEKYGIGSGGVRLLSGTFKLHEELEEKIADFKGAEAAVVFAAGYMTNVGLVPTLVGKNGVAIADDKSHASIIDGALLSSGDLKVFKHNNMTMLELLLKKCEKYSDKLIVTDGVFSMDGDIADLPQICRLAKKHKALVMIDEAHSTGVLGKEGRGTPEHFNMLGRVDVIVGTLSKALGGIGGFVCGTKEMISYIKHASRAFIFSSSLPPSITAALITAIDVIKNEPELLGNLWNNTNFMRKELQRLGYDTGNSQTPIIPVILKDEFKVYVTTRELDKMGIFVSPVTFPAVRKRESRIRLNIMASHTLLDLEEALDAFRKLGKELALL